MSCNGDHLWLCPHLSNYQIILSTIELQTKTLVIYSTRSLTPITVLSPSMLEQEQSRTVEDLYHLGVLMYSRKGLQSYYSAE